MNKEELELIHNKREDKTIIKTEKRRTKLKANGILLIENSNKFLFFFLIFKIIQKINRFKYINKQQ